MFGRAGSQPIPVQDRLRPVQAGWADGFPTPRSAASSLLPEAVGLGGRRPRHGEANPRQRDHDGRAVVPAIPGADATDMELCPWRAPLALAAKKRAAKTSAEKAAASSGLRLFDEGQR